MQKNSRFIYKNKAAERRSTTPTYTPETGEKEVKKKKVKKVKKVRKRFNPHNKSGIKS